MTIARLQDRYELAEELGTGATSVVYRALDHQFGREVAIKILRDRPSEGDARRFEREARIAAKLRHPEVVAIYDVGEHDGRPFLVMELVRGPTLAAVLAAEPHLPITTSAEIGAKLATILSAAHAAGFVHRDVKPGNVFVADPTAPGRCRLTDFGLAFMTIPDSSTLGRFTIESVLLGTPLYMSPEQAEAGEVGPASDVYSLGCVLHEMVAGRPPFVGNIARVLAGHLYLPPIPLRELVLDAPVALETLVLDMLAKAPAQRPTAAEVASRLGGLELSSTRGASEPRRGRTTTPPVELEPPPITLVVDDPELAAGLRERGFTLVADSRYVITSLAKLPSDPSQQPFVIERDPSLSVISAAIRAGAIGVGRWPGPLDALAQQLRAACRRIRRVP